MILGSNEIIDFFGDKSLLSVELFIPFIIVYWGYSENPSLMPSSTICRTIKISPPIKLKIVNTASIHASLDPPFKIKWNKKLLFSAIKVDRLSNPIPVTIMTHWMRMHFMVLDDFANGLLRNIFLTTMVRFLIVKSFYQSIK